MLTAQQDDVVAVHRAFLAGGRDAAMAELRRRWWRLSDATAPDALDRILALPVVVPSASANRQSAQTASRPKPPQPD